MNAATDRLEFAPPPQPGMLRAYALAVLVHLLLIAALTWGVHWKRDAENVAVEAELWSSVPQQAAPRAVESPPQPTPPPPTPTPVPQPVPVPAPPPPPPARVAPSLRDADIAIERQKKELEKEKLEQQQKLEQDKRDRQKKLDAEKREQEKQAALEKKKQEQAQALVQQQEAEKKAAEKAKALAQAKEQAQAKAEAQAKAQADAKAKAQAKAQADKLHQQTVKNMLAMANAEGGANATGNALRASGRSGDWGARIAAAVRPNIVFANADLVSGNPAATFNVRLAPDGTIVGTPQLVKSSGLPGWDDAALRGLERTGKLPRNDDGTVLPMLTIDLKPKQER